MQFRDGWFLLPEILLGALMLDGLTGSRYFELHDIFMVADIRSPVDIP